MIQVENLSKNYGSKTAVDGVSFTVERGEVLGFLGPNGAGKSTTMRMVTGFTPPTSGSIHIGGYNVATHPISAQRLMGYLPENAPSYPDMTVSEFLHFAAEIRGLKGSEKKQAVNRALEMCFLEPVCYQSIDTLSKGYRHRTCFAQAIIHDPEVLILDEPTDGLDPNQKHEVRTLIRRMGEKKAIIFSTHILEEVEAACSRAIIIDRGKIVANGTPEELKKRSTSSGVVRLGIASITASAVAEKLKSLSSQFQIQEIKEEGSIITARLRPNEQKNGEESRALFELVRREGWVLTELHTEEGRLDEVFRQITLPDRIQTK